jgi:hypothetical protein
MPQCQFPVFCCFCVSEKLHWKYSQNWTKQKPNIQKFTEASREPKRNRSGATRGPHNRAAQPRAKPRPLCVWPPRSTSDDAPSPIKTPRRKKPKHPITFPETHRDPPSSSTRDREGPEALPGILIRLKRIYNFLCSMLVSTPFAYCFVTLRGIFMRFPELTY